MVWIRNISTVIAGNLATGKKHGYTMLNMKPPVPHVIGRNVDDGFVVRTVLEDDSVIAYRFEGFRRFTKMSTVALNKLDSMKIKHSCGATIGGCKRMVW